MIYIIFIIIFNTYLFLLIKKKYIKKRKFKIINDNCEIIKKNIGGGKKIIVVKNFIKLFRKTLNYYFVNKNNTVRDNSSYPGTRVYIPEELEAEIKNFMILINRKYYKIKGEILSFDTTFSITDMKKEDFNLPLGIPHQDNIIGPGLAMTLYLCEKNPKYGGTMMYDFKNEQAKYEYYEFNGTILKDIQDNPFSYDITKKYFKLLHNEELEINKAVIYPCSYWHIANIIPDNYKENKNRLTITAFISFYDDSVNGKRTNLDKNDKQINQEINYKNQMEYYYPLDKKILTKTNFYL